MRKLTRNTAAVLVLTLFTGLAVFTAIQLGDRLLGTSEANAQAVTTATQSSSDDQSVDDSSDEGSGGYGNGYGKSSGDAGETYPDPYGYGDSSGSSGSSGESTKTCPATGCSASTCHALQ